MDYMTYILPIVIIVALIVFLFLKFRTNGTPNAKQTTIDENYTGIRKNVIISSLGSKKLEAIKYVREATGISLAEAKNAVVGGCIENVPIELAETLVGSLENIGVSAELER